jgi:hypothetical protein
VCKLCQTSKGLPGILPPDTEPKPIPARRPRLHGGRDILPPDNPEAPKAYRINPTGPRPDFKDTTPLYHAAEQAAQAAHVARHAARVARDAAQEARRTESPDRLHAARQEAKAAGSPARWMERIRTAQSKTDRAAAHLEAMQGKANAAAAVAVRAARLAYHAAAVLPTMEQQDAARKAAQEAEQAAAVAVSAARLDKPGYNRPSRPSLRRVCQVCHVPRNPASFADRAARVCLRCQKSPPRVMPAPVRAVLCPACRRKLRPVYWTNPPGPVCILCHAKGRTAPAPDHARAARTARQPAALARGSAHADRPGNLPPVDLPTVPPAVDLPPVV